MDKYVGSEFIKEIKTKPNRRINISDKVYEQFLHNSNDILYEIIQYISHFFDKNTRKCHFFEDGIYNKQEINSLDRPITEIYSCKNDPTQEKYENT